MGLTGLAVMAVAITATLTTVNAGSNESDLLSQNLEALTQGEWAGWSKGYRMDNVWKITGGGAQGGPGGGGGNVEGMYINCCRESKYETDACNRMAQSMLCN